LSDLRVVVVRSAPNLLWCQVGEGVGGHDAVAVVVVAVVVVVMMVVGGLSSNCLSKKIKHAVRCSTFRIQLF
jgi:hypothetical protein